MMEQTLHTVGHYDYRQHDRIWRRVSPQMEPYPGFNGQTVEEQTGAVQQEMLPPGATTDPCCMGTAAAEMLDVLQGYIEETRENHRVYAAMLRCAPPWARSALRELAAEKGNQEKRLLAMYYLITGACYHPMLAGGTIHLGNWCENLRRQYHAEACGGLNYARSAEGTTDPCLRGLLEEFSAEEYRHADRILALLERSLQGRN